MSRSTANEYRVDIASVKEILFIFVTFTIILYFIYPDEMQKEQVLTEKSNYALAAIYLENMLRLDPKNTDLMFASIEADLENGKIKLAKKMIDIIKNSTDKNSIKKLQFLQFKLYIITRNRETDEKKRKKIESTMIESIIWIANRGDFEKKHAFLWYRYAMSLDQHRAALKFLKPIYESGEISALRECTYLANELKLDDIKLSCIKSLTNSDINNTKKWLFELYSIYVASNNMKKAIDVMRRLAKIDLIYKEQLASLEFNEGMYKESSETFISLYNSVSDVEKRREYLASAIQVLIDGDMKDEVIKLIHKYEDIYIYDDSMMQKFIKLYMGMDRLKEARRLSIKLLHDINYSVTTTK